MHGGGGQGLCRGPSRRVRLIPQLPCGSSGLLWVPTFRQWSLSGLSAACAGWVGLATGQRRPRIWWSRCLPQPLPLSERVGPEPFSVGRAEAPHLTWPGLGCVWWALSARACPRSRGVGTVVRTQRFTGTPHPVPVGPLDVCSGPSAGASPEQGSTALSFWSFGHSLWGGLARKEYVHRLSLPRSCLVLHVPWRRWGTGGEGAKQWERVFLCWPSLMQQELCPAGPVGSPSQTP